jgi:hypothetical protein
MMVDKQARLYVGAGSNQGISKDTLAGQVASACGLASEDVRRVSVRGAYSFVDVSEKVADQVVEKLADSDVGGRGEKLFVKRAVTLSIPREPTPEELAAMQQQSEESFQGQGRHDRDAHSDRDGHHHQEERQDYDQEGEGDEGPTLLAVDDQA